MIFQYDRICDIWRSFCRENDVVEFGKDHKPLVACLSFVMIQSGSYAKVGMLRAVIAHEYRIRMLSSPTIPTRRYRFSSVASKMHILMRDRLDCQSPKRF